MKTYALVCKQDEPSVIIGQQIRQALDKTMNYDEDNPELVISVGGDGTMLHCVHLYENQLDQVAFIGMHTGTLGFLTDYQKDEVEQLIQDIQIKDYRIYERELLNIQTNLCAYLALNEFRIENNMRSQVLDVSINNEFLETFRGNGLCISTPSGSTAYNKSLGGAIVYSQEGLMQLSEIAGIHHNAYRSLGSPLILGDEDVVRFETDFSENAVLGIDTDIYELKDHDVIEARLSKRVAHFCDYRHVSFVKRLRKSYL